MELKRMSIDCMTYGTNRDRMGHRIDDGEGVCKIPLCAA